MTLNTKDINPGDTIVLEHEDGSRLVGEYLASGDFIVHNSSVGKLNTRNLLGTGWKLTEIRKPRPELPTEPGLYIESGKEGIMNVWTLGTNGRWFSAAYEKYDDRAAEFAPFTRLVPRDELVREILADLDSEGFFNGHQLAAWHEHFGATP